MPKVHMIMTFAVFAVLCLSACNQPKKKQPVSAPEKYIFARRVITVTSEPNGARVSQINPATGNKIFLGMTPLEKVPAMVIIGVRQAMDWQDVDMLAGEIGRVHIYVEKWGYKPYENLLNADPNTVTTLNVRLDR